MDKGSITIHTEGTNSSVEARLVNNDLWLAKFEIARLFNCMVPKIDANIRSIFKNRLLRERDCTYCNRYTDKGIEKQTLYYNMEMLIFLSYRIDSFEAEVFRRFINSSLRKHLQQKRKENECRIYYMYRSDPSCWRN